MSKDAVQANTGKVISALKLAEKSNYADHYELLMNLHMNLQANILSLTAANAEIISADPLGAKVQATLGSLNKLTELLGAVSTGLECLKSNKP